MPPLVVNQDIRELKDLPKLIIVDMSGNPLVLAEDYRLFAIYFLRRLKVGMKRTLLLNGQSGSVSCFLNRTHDSTPLLTQVLDGVSVDSEELAASKNVYSGRLTTELLEEKIGKLPCVPSSTLSSCKDFKACVVTFNCSHSGHEHFETIRELDLASCRIREIEALKYV